MKFPKIPEKFSLHGNGGGRRTSRPDVQFFLTKLVQLCREHKLSLSHEDKHGGFIIEPYSKFREKWLLDASVDAKPDLRNEEYYDKIGLR